MSNESLKFDPDELQTEFLQNIRFMLDSIEESFLKLDAPENRREELTNIFRVIHSVKGAAGAVGFDDLSAFAHIVEDLLQILRVEPGLVTQETVTLLLKSIDLIKGRTEELSKGIMNPWDISDTMESLKQMAACGMSQFASKEQLSSETPAAAVPFPKKAEPVSHDSGGDDQGKLLKVDSGRVTSVIELVGELVTIKSQILRDPAMKTSSTLRASVDLLDKAIRDLHDQALSLRMTTLKTTFKKIQRIARDLSVKLEKPISLTITGDDTEMDRTLTEMLTDPLVHLIRNAIDHGVESAEKRRAAGKNEVGMISISATQRNGRILIEIRDDGNGIDRARVIAKAKQNGLIAQERKDADIPDKEVFALIFAPGFSTAEKVTDISGRGVGLDVVKTNIQSRMKGFIDIESKLGSGSMFRLSLPLTTSITEGILALAGGRKFILPVDRMRELIQSRDLQTLSFASGGSTVRVRDQLLPYISLKELLCGVPRKPTDPIEGTLIVMEAATTLVAVGVDQVISQTQVVLKPLNGTFRNQPEISGATILGDGSVALVLEVDGLLTIRAQQGAPPAASAA